MPEYHGQPMINIGGTSGTAVEVWVDVEQDRVMILADQLYPFWRTGAEAEALAQHLQAAAAELRRIAAGKRWESFIESHPLLAHGRSMDPVSQLHLSTRTANCLKKAEIRTIGELAYCTAAELQNIRGFGKRALAEVNQKLKERGLELRSRFAEEGEAEQLADNLIMAAQELSRRRDEKDQAAL